MGMGIGGSPFIYSWILRHLVGRTGENSGSEKDVRRRQSISMDPDSDPVTIIVCLLLLLALVRRSIAGGKDFVGVETIIR